MGAGREVHLHITPARRQLSVYAAGSSIVHVVSTHLVSAHDGVAHAQLDHQGARKLTDALASATGHYPTSLDAQRARIADLTAELRDLTTGDGHVAELAELALTRHVGEMIATAADLVHQCRAYLADHHVAAIAAELIGMLDAMRVGHETLTNPEARFAAHYDRIQVLRAELPPTGPDHQENPDHA